MSTREYEGLKFDNGISHPTKDILTIEEALQININGTPFTITMRTPGDDDYLISGLLHSEGVVRKQSQSLFIEYSKEQDSIVTNADVSVAIQDLKEGYNNSRSLLSVSSCGICGKTELEDLCNTTEVLNSTITIDPSILPSLFTQMSHKQSAFSKSGGSHAAAGFNTNGELICSFEDIGRHNAVDKVIGWLIRNNQLNNCVCLTVSGRISYEIVVKCFKGHIPILASVSAPSSLAADYAKELGISLFSFCRDERATCYANTQRVKNNALNNKAV